MNGSLTVIEFGKAVRDNSGAFCVRCEQEKKGGEEANHSHQPCASRREGSALGGERADIHSLESAIVIKESGKRLSLSLSALCCLLRVCGPLLPPRPRSFSLRVDPPALR